MQVRGGAVAVLLGMSEPICAGQPILSPTDSEAAELRIETLFRADHGINRT